MVRAVGYSSNPFDPRDPGRLCRGRERWIEPWELEEQVEPVVRIVVSGATFSDDGAADAQRGLPHSGLDFTSVVEALYPLEAGTRWIAFMEDGHPADIPTEAVGVEAYDGHRAGGRQDFGLVRWHLPVSDPAVLRELLAGAPAEERIRGLVVLREPDAPAPADGQEERDNELMERVFHLVGFSTLDSPPARYQPSALPEVLALAEAVVLLHRDKHGPALAVYARGEVPDLQSRLGALSADGIDPLVVPFAIPPMLARWDRALAELRDAWPSTRNDPVPVPVATTPPMLPGGRRMRRPRDEEPVEADDAPPTKRGRAAEE
ncbi:MAG: hypothetical protein R3F59_01840 [Myxococcota bacterium]